MDNQKLNQIENQISENKKSLEQLELELNHNVDEISNCKKVIKNLEAEKQQIIDSINNNKLQNIKNRIITKFICVSYKNRFLQN